MPQQTLLDFNAAEKAPVKADSPEPTPVPKSDISAKPYTFDEHKKFCRKMSDGEMTVELLQATFRRAVASKDQFVAELISTCTAPKLKAMAFRFGCFRARENTKPENAAHVFKSLLYDFSLENSVAYQPLSGETFEDALAKQVEAITEEALQAALADAKAAQESRKKALTNPETLAEFRVFVAHKGEDELSELQLAQFDSMAAAESRRRRFEKQPQTVGQIESEGAEGLQLTIKEGYHTKRECAIWIVQLSKRIERSAFAELKRKAKMLGGWYSSFIKGCSGFQFLTPESATKFAALLEGDADRSEELEARKVRKEETAAERLSRLADSLEESAQDVIAADANRVKNTARQAQMAAGARGRAFADLALAETMNHIALALERGEAGFLDGLRHKTQVQTLGTLLKQAQYRHVRKTDEDSSRGFDQRQADWDRPPSEGDVRFAEYPYPCIYRRHLEEAVARVANKKGCIQEARKFAKLLKDAPEYVIFKESVQIERLMQFLDRIKGRTDTACIERGMEDYKRLQAANVHDIHELRAALRDLLRHRGQAPQDDPVVKAEDELRGKQLPGFFPTPRLIIDRMIELADIEPGHRVLEPSCGKGDILDVLSERFNVTLTAIERNQTLSAILAAKGYDVRLEDFLDFQGEFDRVLMNPPFENSADILHVQHAFKLLAPQGVLVAIMSEGPFFRNDENATAFREWLGELRAHTEQLPENAFRGVNSFRQTGVRTRLVQICR